MLWQRVLTALVLIPLVVAGILYLDTPMLASVLGLMVLVGAYEMGRLAHLRGMTLPLAFVSVVAVLLWLAQRFVTPPLLIASQWMMALWWTGMTVALVMRRRELPKTVVTRPIILLLGGLVLVTAWVSIVRLHVSGTQGPALVLFLFVLIWIADTGAYFAGRAFGRSKLSPFVSPGKTWAGVGGAISGGLLSGLLLSASGLVGELPMLPWALLCVLVVAISIGGDLWESRLKREAGVKDSGQLLPGHGGMLDRIDSLLAAAPVFALGASLMGGAA